MAKPLTDKELLEGRMSYLGRGLTTPRRLLATIDAQQRELNRLREHLWIAHECMEMGVRPDV
jgi:hypothetical protein